MQPVVVKSPGRINLIGEHTDYNCGLVMPAGIDKAIYVGISRREDNVVRLYSKAYNADFKVELGEVAIGKLGWANYILGVIDQLQHTGKKIAGFNMYIDGEVPLGAGLSSSAALECAALFAIDHLFGLRLSKMEMARMAQSAEHKFAGVNCGIMDQFASLFARKDQAVLLDCRSMEYQYLPLDLGNYQLLLLNTNVKHSLGDTAYNHRREQCEQGVAWIAQRWPNVVSLRDATVDMLVECVKGRDMEVYSKCRYVIEEIARTEMAAQHLRSGRVEALGQLMSQTHQGLSDSYEVSCNELDFLVDQVAGRNGVLGARMMGGGFGGCTLNIVSKENVQELIGELEELYQLEFGNSLTAYTVETGHGTQVLT